jgi:hypothetical protein
MPGRGSYIDSKEEIVMTANPTDPDRKHSPPRPEDAGRDCLNHVHVFITMTDAIPGHQHMLLGPTSPAIARKDHHIHRIAALTSYDPRNTQPHWHAFEVMTGPDFETPDGNHTHYFAGNTSFDLDHCHAFGSVTDTSPQFTPYDEPPPLPVKKRPPE